MLSNKRTRIFVSLLTLVICLGVLAVGTRAQGPTAQDPSQVNAAAPDTDSGADDSGPNPDNNIVVKKNVSDGTVIQSGDEITYVVNVSNTTNATATNVTFSDAVPYNTRFNTVSSTNVIFSDTANTAVLSPSTGVTITVHGDTIDAIVTVEHNDAACNVPIENKAIVTQGGKTYQVTRYAVAYDTVYTVATMENPSATVGTASDADAIELDGANFFTETSIELGWDHGLPISPTYLGAPGGANVWGTNLSGFYTDTGTTWKDQTMTGTLDLTGIAKTDTPLYLSWQQYLDFLTGFNRAQVIIQDGSTSETIYDTGTANNGILDTNGWVMNTVDVQQYAGKQVLLIFRFTTDGNSVNTGADVPHYGWYVDDIALGACNVPALAFSKVAATSNSTCTTDSTSGGTTKKESKQGLSGLFVASNTTVYYCFAVKNTGNLTLTNHTLYDNKLRDGEIITSSTATDYPSSEVVALQTNGLAPLGMTNTYDLLRNTNITPTLAITVDTVNTATWSAQFVDVDYYNILTSTNDKGYTTISSTGEALELKDDSELTITLPFNFTLFDVSHTAGRNVVVGNNGGILFQNTISDVLATNAPLPLTGTHGVDSTQGQAIFPLWDDWATGRVYSDVRGTSPNREWVLEWQVGHKAISGATPDFETTNKVVFQAIMYETTNDVVFVYNDVTLDNSDYSNGKTATIGLSNRLTETRQYSFNKELVENGLEVRLGKSIHTTASAQVNIQDAIAALSMTLSSNGTCSLSGMDTAKVVAGEDITVCYYLVNNGTVTMTHVSLTDTRIGDRLTTSDLTVDLGVYRNTNTLVFSDTFMPTDDMVIDGTSDVVASNKYPFRTSKDSTNAATYSFTDIGFNSGTNEGTKLSMNNAQDNSEENITLDFDFMYYGQVSRNLRIGNNGGILFNQVNGDVSPNNTKLGNAEHGLAIFPYWDTFEGEQGGVYYRTFGTAPNRRLVIQWDEIQHFDQSTDQGTFQAILYEGTNEIKFQYQDLDFGSHSPASNQNEDFNFGASATVGLNHNGSDAHEYSYNNMVQGSNISPSLNVTNSMAILWSPLNDATGSDQVTITVSYTPSIELTKTVGTVPGVCATTDEITVTAGTTVYYCYTVENTGNTTFNNNTLHDDKLGLTVLFNSSQLSLGPDKMTDTVSLGTSSLQAVIMTDTMNTATWTATSDPATRGTAVATDTAKVNIELPPTAVEIGDLGVSRSSGLPLGSLVVGMLLLVAGGYVVHRRRMQ